MFIFYILNEALFFKKGAFDYDQMFLQAYDVRWCILWYC